MSDIHGFVSAPPGVQTYTDDPLPSRVDLAPPVPERRSRRWPQDTAQWVRRNQVDLVIVAALILVVGLVHGIGMNASPAPVDDEGTYVAQGWAVVARHALTPYTYWYDHPPLGWILIGVWGWFTHGFRPGQLAVVTGREFILVTQLVATALVYLIGRRLGLSRLGSAAAVLAWALSPLVVDYGRQVYLDNVALPFLLGAFALALTPRRGLWALSAAGALLGAAVLCKETFLVFLPALAWQAWQQTDKRTRAFCLTGFLVGLAVVLVGYPLYALLKGELLPGPGHVSLFDAIRFQLSGRQSSGNVFNATSQAGSQVRGWLHLDPWLLGAGTVLLPVAIWVRRLRPVGVAYLIGLLVGVHGGYLPEPYLIALLPLAALVAVGGVAALAGALPPGRGALGERRPRHRMATVRMAVVLAAAGAVTVVGVAPAWARADRSIMTTDAWGPYRQAEAWVEANVSHQSRILVDDTMWVDLEQHGFDHHLQVVWFYKLGFANNLDPSVARSLPGGWKDFRYVIVTPSMRGALVDNPRQETEVQDAISHSSVVARFGTGTAEIDIRRVNNGGRT